MLFQLSPKRRQGFTLVELIVVITILAILGTLAYISLLGYGLVARDSVRISDIKNITKVIELYKLQEGVYPPVSNPINVTFSGSTIWQQGSFGDETRQFAQRISQVPLDPLTFSKYAYSKTLGTQEFQVGAIVENGGSIAQVPQLFPQSYALTATGFLATFATTMIQGNYNGKFIVHKEGSYVYVLGVPTILTNNLSDVTLQEIQSSNSFVYEGGPAAPATYSGSVENKGTWNFNPTNVSGQINVIYSGSINDFNSGSGKIDLVKNLQNYYAGTDIINSIDFQDVKNIDTVNNPNAAISLVNNFITAGVGGFEKDTFAVTEISNAVSTAPVFAVAVACGRDFTETYNINGGFYMSNTYPNLYAFVTLKPDGSIAVWGDGTNGGSGAPTGTGFTEIYPSRYSFSALKADGSITSWGNPGYGSSVSPTGSGYTKLYSNAGAYAAMKPDGSIKSWGSFTSGAPTGSGYTKIATNLLAFAALKNDGSIANWGSSSYGGTSGAPTGTGFTDLAASEQGFAAMKTDGSIIAWGNYGAASLFGSGFVKIFSNQRAYAALKADGSIFSWGSNSSGYPTGTGYTQIYSNLYAFAAMKADGSISAWGGFGGSGFPTGTGYTRIYSTDTSFTAIKADGSLITWGQFGGAPAGTGFTDISTTQSKISALRPDGSLVMWGGNPANWNTIPIGTGYTKIFSNGNAFTAARVDGSITSWGDITNGGTGFPVDTGYVAVNGSHVSCLD